MCRLKWKISSRKNVVNVYRNFADYETRTFKSTVVVLAKVNSHTKPMKTEYIFDVAN